MTTKPQMRDNTKAQARLARRKAAHAAVFGKRDAAAFHPPGSGKRSFPEGQRARRERTGGRHLAKRNR